MASSRPTKPCFVFMTYCSCRDRNSFEDRYRRIFKKAVEEFRGGEVFSCLRADEIPDPGSITAQFLQELARADVVVADLTDLSANVFYELGVRHALRHGTLLLIEKG